MRIYDIPSCDFDWGDSSVFRNKYPDCDVHEQSEIGNGYCRGRYNNEQACGCYDGGDCNTVTCMIHLKSVMASAIVGLATTLKHAVLMKAIAFNKFQHNNY